MTAARRALDRALPADAAAAVRAYLPVLTVARFATNAVYRFAPPFLATIASGLDVSLARAGVAISASELLGLTSPVIGRLVDRLPRRRAMAIGLAGVTAGAVVAAMTPSLWGLAAGLATISAAKVVFDVGLASWIADEVPYAQRGRVSGITETAWALALLIGVTAMGLVTAAAGWRWAFALGAAGTAVMAAVVRNRLPGHPVAVRRTSDRPQVRLPRSAWLMIGAMCALMAASQCVFVTFGAWLQDRFGFGGVGIASVGFGLGAIELGASLTSAGRADHWGKHRSAAAGCLLMAPAGALMWLADDHLATGLVLLGTYLLGFEFAIVSAVPAAVNLVPGAPGAGLGAAIGGGAIGRAAMALAATAAYDRAGLGAPTALGAGLAIIAAALFTAHGSLHPER